MRPRLARNTPGGAELPLALLYPLFFVLVFVGHWTLLRLPYFWDEAGYYVPAAYDFFRTGTLIPKSTLTNAHPPMPSLLLAAWWHLSGFVISGTRTLVCLVAAAALLAVYRLGRRLAGETVGWVTVALTAVYPIWYAQSTLAHADIFAAAFTLWALSFYLAPGGERGSLWEQVWVGLLFSLAALSKETAIVIPVSLACFDLLHGWRQNDPQRRRDAWRWAACLAFPVLPLLCWYGYHYSQTGFVFGNPEYLRYNATANLDLHRIVLCLWHRLLHMTAHMNLYVATLCTAAALLMPQRRQPGGEARGSAWRRALPRIGLLLLVNWLEFSILGGALLTRYLLPMYPLFLLFCVRAWVERMRWWPAVAALTIAAFAAGIWINPPYAFAPEDNLTYRDMVVVHQAAVGVIARQYPKATVLTAWPATAELERPELGYTRHPIRTSGIENFSRAQIARASTDPGAFDTALLFSTKWEPAAGQPNLAAGHESADARYFDFHHDLSPGEAAALLHGDVVWEQQRKGEWAAILRFPRVVNAAAGAPPAPAR